MTHHKLTVWQKSIELVTLIYRSTASFPKHELVGLSSQMRGAAVSIPSNIAEGAARESTKEYLRFLNISLGSAAELETQIIISNNLGYLPEIIKMLNKLVSSLKQKMN